MSGEKFGNFYPLNLLTIKHLRVSIQNQQKETAIIKDVSFTIAAGEILALVGESGSGKSTVALAIGNLLPQNARTTGTILFLGREKPQSFLGSNICYIFQESMSCLNPLKRIGDQIAEGFLYHNPEEKKATRARVLRLLNRLQFKDAESVYSSYPHQLSGGMQQRILIAIALINNPQLLLADEPTTALDTVAQRSVLELLTKHVRKLRCGMLFITHNLAVARKIADRIGVLHQGRLIEVGSTNRILDRPKQPYTKQLVGSLPKHL